MTLAKQARQIVAIATAMSASGRQVDLTGLDRSVGLLCAKALDLWPEEAHLTRLELVALVADLDSLNASMRENPA
ncbi:MAG: hypothetical protein NVSMB18_14390 [Acetobacteraceae bacterium]